MNREQIQRLFAYDDWANDLVFEAAGRLSNEQLNQDMKTSHGGVLGTLVHIVAAEEIWLSRWTGRPSPAPLSVGDLPSLSALAHRWSAVQKERNAFVASFTDEKLDETLRVSMRAGEFVHRYWEMFQHLVNHSSYHRGQIATMLRQLGVAPPPTDLIKFYREEQQADEK